MSTITILRNALPVVNIPDIGPAVVIFTTGAVEYAPGMSLETALAAHQAQLVDSAKLVARNTADMADLISYMREHFGYVERDHQTDGIYLNPLFELVEKAPTGTPENVESEESKEAGA